MGVMRGFTKGFGADAQFVMGAAKTWGCERGWVWHWVQLRG